MRRPVLACLVAGALTSSAAPAFATSGYGPTTASGGSQPPGGFSNVVVAKTFGPRGGSAHTTIGCARITVSLPSGAVSRQVTVKVTSPNLKKLDKGLKRLRLGSFTAVAGVGVSLLRTDGQSVSKPLSRPMVITLSCRSFGRTDRAYDIVGATHATRLPETISARQAKVSASGGLDLAILQPK